MKTIDPNKYTRDDSDNITHKTCTQCDEHKSLDEFSILKTNKTEGRHA